MNQPDYRRIVLAIIFVIALLIGIKVLLLKPGHDQAAMTINNVSISEEKINRLFSQRSRYLDSKDFIHSVVIRQLLIQEAVKSGIQKEESFRQSVQDFYEQSLIKIVMDRKYDALNPEIDERLVDRYITLSGKTIDFTLLSYRQPDDRVKGIFEGQEKISLPFSRLATEIKLDILSLKPGEMSNPVYAQGEGLYSVLRLDTVSPGDETPHETATDRDSIRAILSEQLKERNIDLWLDSLEAQATVTVGKAIDQLNEDAVEKNDD
jgi:hypothetical protein